jgi:anaerobic magnesium-protoporphyrin IX monomethyl ester cyclase
VRVLLLNPSIRPAQFGRFAALLEPMPCIGLAYLATVLTRRHVVEVFDAFALGGEDRGLLSAIERFRPEVIGVSILTPVATRMHRLLRDLKHRHPQLRVVVGNIHADLFPEEFLDGAADAVVHGEGEETLLELLDAWERDDPGEGIPGVSVRSGGTITRGPTRPLLQDLDSLPMPRWDLLPYHRYRLLPMGTVATPLVSILASRGCPFRCRYCCLQIQGSEYRRRSIRSVVDEIQRDHRRYGARQVGFMDPIFPLGDRHAIEFSREMLRRGLHRRVRWLSELRTDSVTEEGLRWMAKAGCRRLVFGIESGSDALLKSVGKRNKIENARRTIEACRRLGIGTVGLFMLGLPDETPAQTRETIEFACSLPLDFAKFAITVPFPGSELFEEMARSGRLPHREWEQYTTFNPDLERIVVASDVQSPKQLLEALRFATARFYMRPRLIARQLLQLRALSARQMALGLWSVLPDLPQLAGQLRSAPTGPGACPETPASPDR